VISLKDRCLDRLLKARRRHDEPPRHRKTGCNEIGQGRTLAAHLGDLGRPIIEESQRAAHAASLPQAHSVTLTHSLVAAERSMASQIAAARAPSAKVGRPSGGEPSTAAYESATKLSKHWA
jgi:hypothetical protein